MVDKVAIDFWMKFFGKKTSCNHKSEPGTGRSTEVDVNLYIKPKGLESNDYFGPNVRSFTGVAYAVVEVACKKCGKQIDRRSIEVRPEDIEIPLPEELRAK